MSAPRIPNDIEYWKSKGKTGKDVCLIIHDDMDGIVSGILMKNYLLNHNFTIKKYAIINYQQSWDALELDTKLINIALDFAEDLDEVDVYMDHHGTFDDEVRLKQQRPSIKTKTGSAAEGIALQLGIPFGSDTQYWIDMIDSAKYFHYNIDIVDILNFDLKDILKDKNPKLRFAAAFNQILKRSDFTTFIEVLNASNDVSIFNLFRLFKIFFPKNNPNWKTGVEANFVEDGRERLEIMADKTRGDDPKKVRYTHRDDFWARFCERVQSDPKLWKVKTNGYQIIGNLMYVPSGTWANALRAKAIFVEDKKSGAIANSDSKLNFVLLQYGNTLQIADLDNSMKSMNESDLPKLKNNTIVYNLGKYMSSLVKNFEQHLDYFDKRTLDGGHDGIGTISNIFGKCKVAPFEGVKFLDMFKNKIINDISSIEWSLAMPWNEEEKPPEVKEDEMNMRMLGMSEIRTEEQAHQETKERRYLSWVVLNDDWDVVPENAFKIESIRKLYTLLKYSKDDLGSWLISDNIKKIYFNSNEKDKEHSEENGNFMFDGFFYDVINQFNIDYNVLYKPIKSDRRAIVRKQTKRLLLMIGNIVRGEYMRVDTEIYRLEYKKWRKEVKI